MTLQERVGGIKPRNEKAKQRKLERDERTRRKDKTEQAMEERERKGREHK